MCFQNSIENTSTSQRHEGKLVRNCFRRLRDGYKQLTNRSILYLKNAQRIFNTKDPIDAPFVRN